MPKYCVCMTLHVVVPLLLVILAFSTVDAANDASNRTRSSSRWVLKEAAAVPRRARGCWMQPWICNRGEKPFQWKKMCCRNQCVNVRTDRYNCGFCGIRCPFTWQCCNGLCVNTNWNPFNCGRCSKRCPFGSLCLYGMCGYSQAPLPPLPFPPFKPKPSNLPHPPKPSEP